jgi:RHS repeat-associated protein
MKLPLVTPIYKDTVYTWTYSSGLVNQTGMIYIDNVEYQITSRMLQSLYLLRMHNPEGYADNVTMNPYGPFYYYYHKDHLGNNREVWKAAYSINGTEPPAAVVQQTSYYPSGLPWSDGSGVSAQPYKYNGKEFVEMHGWDTYDYGARGYYPAMGRFMTVDPLAEMYYSISPYAYCKGNPISMIDPTGMLSEDPHEINWLGSSKTLNLVPNANLKDRVIDHDPKFPFIPPTNKLMYASEEAGNDNGSDSKGLSNIPTSGSVSGIIDWFGKSILNFFFSTNNEVLSNGATMTTLKPNFQGPDYVGIDLSGTGFVPVYQIGGGFDLSLGYVRNDGLFLLGSTRVGAGYDFSISGGLSLGVYSGKAPLSATSLSGEGLHLTIGVGPVSYSLLQDISNQYGNTRVGSNWTINSISVGVGLTPANVSITKSNSSNPYYLFK